MLELDLEYSCEETYNFDKFLKKIPDGCREDLHIHLNGPGGYTDEMSMYLDFFDRYEGNVTLVCEYETCSADSILFLLSNTKKELSSGASCLLHQSSNIHRSLEYPSLTPIVELQKRSIKILNEYFSANLRLILDKEDFDFFETGEDLIVAGEKLRQVTERAEKLFWKKGKSVE